MVSYFAIGATSSGIRNGWLSVSYIEAYFWCSLTGQSMAFGTSLPRLTW